MKVLSANLGDDEAFHKRFRRDVAVRDSLAPVSQAYRDLAGAARGHDPIGYTIAHAEAAGATQQLGSNLDELAKLGYQVS
jgi:hypothetical protein